MAEGPELFLGGGKLHPAPKGACCGGREQWSCLCFDCSTMQCNKVEKHTKLTSISGHFSSSHSPHHSFSHSCGIKLPSSQRRVTPHGVQSASPAVTVHRSVAGTARGFRVGYEINEERLQASVLPQTTPFQRCVNVCCTGTECLSSARGNTPPRKACCRDGGPHRPRERLLQSLFSGAKERRRTPPNLGPETAESRAFFSKVLIQNDYAETNPLTYQSGRLVYLRGFKECLFSHSGSPPPHALPEICIRGDSVSIHGPALWLMSGPSYVYEMHGCCSLSSEAERNAHPELPRRLASFNPIRERAAQRQAQTPRSYSELRADYK